jgi:hypothetical protein
MRAEHQQARLTSDPPPDEALAIAKEAYIYDFPMGDNYRIEHSYFVESGQLAADCPT